MSDWFTIDRIDADTYIISEYRHCEETHCYLLNGNKRSLLIDTGLGICDISEAVKKVTDKPVTAVTTHIHWDHIGGHKYYPDFYKMTPKFGIGDNIKKTTKPWQTTRRGPRRTPVAMGVTVTAVQWFIVVVLH